MKLRPYQERGVDGVYSDWQAGHRSVLLTIPPGGGKTACASEIIRRERGKRIVVTVPRIELLDQTARALAKVDVKSVGFIAAGRNRSPYADVQITTIQTLCASGQRPELDICIADEARHYAAAEWRQVLEHYSGARICGLDGTPCRSDGRPLNDMFTALVAPTNYTELLALGVLVPCAVYQPYERMTNALALDIVAAYMKYIPGKLTFAFCSNVQMAEDAATRLRAEGVSAQCIHAKTPRGKRAEYLRRFAAREILVLTNVSVLSEGLDIIHAEGCILASPCDHVSTYIQKVSRVLRSAPGKTMAWLVDLVGASLTHGLPTTDREYALEGEGVKTGALPPLTVCAQCGRTQLAGRATCEGCGFKFIRHERKPPVIHSEELRVVFDFEATPTEAKLVEYFRLLDVSLTRSYSLDWVVASYTATFGEKVPQAWLNELPPERKRREFEQWRAHGESRGYAKGYPFARYKARFGTSP